MNNIKPYCWFAHQQLTFKGRHRPKLPPPPVEGNAIILMSFMEDKTLLADIFTLTEVNVSSTPMMLTATNRKGETVSGHWETGRYVWQDRVQDLHSWLNTATRGWDNPFYRVQRRHVKQVMQCVKDQVVVCMDLLPQGCGYSDAVMWAKPVKRIWSRMIFAAQIAIIPLLFIESTLPLFLLVSLILLGGHHITHRWETRQHLQPGSLISEDAFTSWLELTRHIHTGSRKELLPALKEKMDMLFEDAIERTSPDYSLVMRTRYRIAQELLEDIMQRETFSKLKFVAYRTRVIGFIVEP